MAISNATGKLGSGMTYGVSPGENGEPCKVALPGKPGRGVSTIYGPVPQWLTPERAAGYEARCAARQARIDRANAQLASRYTMLDGADLEPMPPLSLIERRWARNCMAVLVVLIFLMLFVMASL